MLTDAAVTVFFSASAKQRYPKAWWLRKKSQNALFCHSRGGGNPVFPRYSGLPPSREWRPCGLFTSASKVWVSLHWGI